MEHYNFFSIPVVRHQNIISNTEATEIFKYLIGLDNASPHEYIIGNGKTSGRTINPQVLKEFPQIEQNIQTLVDQFTEKLGVFQTKIINSWYNIQYDESELKPHVHPLGAVSGALMVNVDDNSSGLRFRNPNYELMNFCWWLTSKETEYNKEYETFGKVKTGDLFLFPSYLYHGGVLNHTNARAVIAFDCVYDLPKD